MNDAKLLRKSILEARNQLSQESIIEKSQAIERTLLSLNEVAKRQTILVYISFRSEVITTGLVNKLIEMGKTVTVPITRKAENRIDAIQITNLLTDMEPGYCHIPEPKPEICLSQKIDPTTIDTILLPGSVFDKRGGRFGYGGGYYDRFLEANPRAARIGLAFDMQIVDEAPLSPHDQLPDMVVTESRVLKGTRSVA